MTETAAPPAESPADEPKALVTLSPAAMAAIDKISAIPESDPDDAISRILEQIASAQSPADLDAPWRSEGLKAYLRRRITVTDLRRAESTKNGPVPWFLIVEGADPDTGEKIVTTTGALGVMAQLIEAYVRGWLPMTFGVTPADRLTRGGFETYHLTPIAKAAKR